MSSILQNLPNIVMSMDGGALSPFNLHFSDPTIGFMKKNISTIDRMAVGFDYSSKFDDFAESLSHPTSIGSFINKVREEDVFVADYLEKVVKTFSIDKSLTTIVDLVWAANLTNTLGEQDTRMEMLLSDLLFSLQHSTAYKNVNPMEVRGRILEMFENDIDEDLAESYFDVDAEQAQRYLGVAYTDNDNTKDITKWYDYRSFKEITSFDAFEINNEEDLKLALSTSSVSAYRAASIYIKKTYLSSTDPNHPGYCADELEREYKATLILSSLAHEYGFGDFDENNSVGFNLLARLKNIPELMQEKNPLISVSDVIHEMKQEASLLTKTEILKEEPVEKKPEENTEDEQAEEQTPVLTSEEYTKKQLSTFNKFIDKKRLEIVSTLDFLVKTRGTKSNFKKIEARLATIAADYGVELLTAEDEKNTKDRIDANIDLLIPAVNKRFDELGRAKEIFKIVRRKMGTNLDLDGIAFDKELLGKNVNVVSPYQEGLIRSFYKAIQADPTLKSDAVYRRRTQTFTMANIDERVKADDSTAPELSSVFRAFKLTPTKEAQYEEDKKIPVLIEDEDEGIAIS